MYLNDYKTKSEDKNTTDEYKYFLQSNFVGVNRSFILVNLNWDNDLKGYKAFRHYLPKFTIKNCNVIINENKFYDKPNDFDISDMNK